MGGRDLFSAVFIYQGMLQKLPVVGFMYAKVCYRSCQWQVLCIFQYGGKTADGRFGWSGHTKLCETVTKLSGIIKDTTCR